MAHPGLVTASDCRWYVTRDGRPVDWSRAVVGGIAVEDVMAVRCTPGSSQPWAVLWVARGAECPPEQVAYAKATVCEEPLPPLRRRPPAPVDGPGKSRAELRLIRGGAE